MINFNIIPETLINIIEILTEKTNHSVAHWQLLNAPNEYQIKLSSGNIVVDKWHDIDKELDFVSICTFNENGDQVSKNIINEKDDRIGYVAVFNLHSSIEGKSIWT